MSQIESPEKFTINEWIGIEQFLMSCTIPILAEYEDKAGVHGTGVLFSVDDYQCILTAAHVADDIVKYPDNIGVPAKHFTPSSQILTLKDCDVILPKSEEDKKKYDIAVILLNKNEYLLNYLKEDFCFLSLQNIVNYKKPVKDYLIAGYPHEMSNLIDMPFPQSKLILGNLFKFKTELYTGTIEKHIELNHPNDIFLSYSEKLESNKGVKSMSPKLEGISGSAIWVFDYDSQQGKIWSPENFIKIAGFQFAYLPKKWIRGIKMYALVHTFGQIDEKAKDKITIQLGYTPESR